MEVRIRSFDNLRAVETGKRNKYDLLANHCATIHTVANTKIIPYVMRWEWVMMKQHCRDLGIDRKIEMYRVRQKSRTKGNQGKNFLA